MIKEILKEFLAELSFFWDLSKGEDERQYIPELLAHFNQDRISNSNSLYECNWFEDSDSRGEKKLICVL